jgi:hypothetical protein
MILCLPKGKEKKTHVRKHPLFFPSAFSSVFLLQAGPLLLSYTLRVQPPSGTVKQTVPAASRKAECFKYRPISV